jgi:hypothetical protein
MVKLLRRIINLFKKCKMAQINNLTSYGISTPVTGDDIVIGSDGGGNGPTKNFQMSNIATYVMSPSVSTITLDQVCLVGSSTTTGITVAGTTTLNGVLDANSTADISGNTTIGGTLGVTGVSTLGEIDASGVADIADTLTLSKATGTGLQVDANANIDGIVYANDLSGAIGLVVASGALIGGNLGVGGDTTFTGAIDANSTADIADTLTLSKVTGTGLYVEANATIDGILSLTRTGGNGLSVTDSVTIGGGIECYGLHHQWGALTVEGITNLNAALVANSTADIADTLTLSKATGTGLDVVADASIGGTLTMGIGDGVVTNRITAPSLANIAFYMGGVQRGAFTAPLGGFVLGYGLTVSSGSTTLQDTLIQGGLYTTPDTPASASASGMAGQIAVDTDYIYVCTATNTWKRVAIATW